MNDFFMEDKELLEKYNEFKKKLGYKDNSIEASTLQFLLKKDSQLDEIKTQVENNIKAIDSASKQLRDANAKVEEAQEKYENQFTTTNLNEMKQVLTQMREEVEERKKQEQQIKQATSQLKNTKVQPVSKGKRVIKSKLSGIESPKDIYISEKQYLTENKDDSYEIRARKVIENNWKIIDRFARVNKDVTNLADERLSQKQIIKQLQDKYKEVGIGVKYIEGGNKIGLYPLEKYKTATEAPWDKIAQVEVAWLDREGTQLKKGNQSFANISNLTHVFDEKTGIPKLALISAYDLQFQKLLNMRGFKKDDNGNLKQSALVSAIKNGDIKKASSIMKLGVNKAITGIPSSVSNAAKDEALSSVYGMKNPEQMVAINGMYSITDMIEQLFRYRMEEINDIYKANGVKRELTTDTYELTPQEYKAGITAFVFSALNLEKEYAQDLQSGLLKELLTSDTFSYFRKDAKTASYQNLRPVLESLKEEGVLSNFIGTAGAQDVLPLGQLGDLSSRALNQVFNYNDRAFTPKIGRQNIFTSDIGRKNGVDYNKRELYNYIGSQTTDADINKAIQALQNNKDARAQFGKFIPSVQEGGIIIPQSLANELASYRDAKQFYSFKDLNSLIPNAGNVTGTEIFLNALGVESIDQLVQDKVYPITKVFDENNSMFGQLSDALKLSLNDMIVGITKTDEGLKLDIRKFEEVKEGSKLLLGSGGRQTARIVSDESFGALTEALNLPKDVQYLTEKQSITSKTLMESLRGRIGFFVEEALNTVGPNGATKDLQEVLQALRKTQIGKSFKIIGNKLESTLFFDYNSNSYKYTDDAGSVKDLFVPKSGENYEDAIRRALIEGVGSDLEQLGINLLGKEKYNATRALVSDFINMATEVPYFDKVGYSNPNDIEKTGRVKFDDRERRAEMRTLEAAKQALPEQFAKGMELFIEDEKQQISRFGQEGLRAQSDINMLNKAIYGIDNGGYASSSRNVLNVSFDQDGALLIDGEKYGHGYSKEIGEWDASKGIKTLDFSKSILGILRDKQKELKRDEIVLTSRGKKYLLADVKGAYRTVNENDDYYIPSEIDRANMNLLRAASNFDESQSDFIETINEFKKEYDSVANSKDSELFRKATQSLVTNSGYSKIVGLNSEQTYSDKAFSTGSNTMYASEGAIRQMLSSGEGANNYDKATSIRNLSYMLKANGAKGIKNYTNISSLSKKSMTELANIEEELINGIVERIKNGEMDLMTQYHRYPSTSSRDIRFSRLSIDTNLTNDDTLEIARGLALTANADYDGDKSTTRLLFAGSNYSNYNDFQEAYRAAEQVTRLDDEVARLMEEWERNNNKNKGGPDLSGDSVVKDEANKIPNIVASIMSKVNKQNVGYFSNLSTNTRNFMQELGIDEIKKAGTRQAGQAAIIRAYMESLEQDSISAKKVFQRLATTNDESFTIDELDKLYSYMNSGAFSKAIQLSQGMGLGFEDSRQLELVKNTLKVYSPELYQKEFADVFEEKDKGLRQTKIINLLEDSFNMLSREASARNITAEDFTSKRWAKKDLKASPRRAKIAQDYQEKTEKLAEDVRRNIGHYNSGVAINSDTYNEDHSRFVGVNGDTYEGKQVYSVTQLINPTEENMPDWKRELLDRAAAQGTFAHKIAEVLGDKNVTNINELDENSMREISQAKIELENTLRQDATPELIDRLVRRAQTVAAIAKQEGLMGENAIQEMTLGGKFEGMNHAIAGQADVISYNDSGLMVGDYKFSTASDQGTVSERVLQASIYMALYEEELEAELAELNQVEDKTEEQKSRVENINKLLEASKTGRTVKVLRSFEKNGRQFVEVLQTEAMSREEALKTLGHIAGLQELEDKLREIDKNISSSTSQPAIEALKEEKEKVEQQIRALIRSKSRFSSSDILGGRDIQQTYFNESGKQVDQSVIQSNGSNSKLINSYLSNLKQQYKIQEDITRLELQSQGKKGKELLESQSLLGIYQRRLSSLKEQAPMIDQELLSEEEKIKLKQQEEQLDLQHLQTLTKINMSQRVEKGLLEKLVGGFKQQIQFLIDRSLAYSAVGKIRQIFQTLISTTKQLDQALVNIQIATGNTRVETREMLKQYSALATELGRTTQEVAAASNDWLRAGYEGKEAAELTKASMMLSTLGMIDSAEATKYLISTLKGWKLQADEVINVVDKLSAVD